MTCCLLLQVWEVVAQLIGLGLSIALLNAIEATGDTTNAVWAWVAIQSVHVVLRYKSLSVIQLPTLNQKRACLLVNAFLEGQQLPGNSTVQLLQCSSSVHQCLKNKKGLLSGFQNQGDAYGCVEPSSV